MEVYDVVVKLIGPTVPLGESHTDEQRLGNLKAMTELAGMLISDISYVAGFRDNHAASEAEAGKHAKEFIDTVVTNHAEDQGRTEQW